jgi:hypothetical protein
MGPASVNITHFNDQICTPGSNRDFCISKRRLQTLAFGCKAIHLRTLMHAFAFTKQLLLVTHPANMRLILHMG